MSEALKIILTELAGDKPDNPDCKHRWTSGKIVSRGVVKQTGKWRCTKCGKVTGKNPHEKASTEETAAWPNVSKLTPFIQSLGLTPTGEHAVGNNKAYSAVKEDMKKVISVLTQHFGSPRVIKTTVSDPIHVWQVPGKGAMSVVSKGGETHVTMLNSSLHDLKASVETAAKKSAKAERRQNLQKSLQADKDKLAEEKKKRTPDYAAQQRLATSIKLKQEAIDEINDELNQEKASLETAGVPHQGLARRLGDTSFLVNYLQTNGLSGVHGNNSGYLYQTFATRPEAMANALKRRQDLAKDYPDAELSDEPAIEKFEAASYKVEAGVVDEAIQHMHSLGLTQVSRANLSVTKSRNGRLMFTLADQAKNFNRVSKNLTEQLGEASLHVKEKSGWYAEWRLDGPGDKQVSLMTTDTTLILSVTDFEVFTQSSDPEGEFHEDEEETKVSAKYIESAALQNVILAASDPVKKKLREQRSKLVKRINALVQSRQKVGRYGTSKDAPGHSKYMAITKQINALKDQKAKINEQLKRK